MVSWAVQKQRLSGVSTAAPVQTSDDYFISPRVFWYCKHPAVLALGVFLVRKGE